MSTWNRYRTFEDFENAELWSSEIVGGALESLDNEWSGFDDKVSFEGDLDDEDDVSDFDDDDEGEGDGPVGGVDPAAGGAPAQE